MSVEIGCVFKNISNKYYYKLAEILSGSNDGKLTGFLNSDRLDIYSFSALSVLVVLIPKQFSCVLVVVSECSRECH